jgi:Protein of unknown function (DUF2911)/Tetratricopeptide repeat
LRVQKTQLMKYFFLTILLITSVTFANAQSSLKLPALSPTARISEDFSLSTIDITYSRPSMRGRKIFGELVPFGRVWRTGANSATKIKFGEDVEIMGQRVKAGEYALYTVPDKDQWRIILNTGTGNWGADGYSKENDVARFTVKTGKMENEVQTFTIEITDITFTTCKISMEWERTKVVLPIEVHNAESVESNIDKAINHPPAIPYFQAANYYYETNQKTELASSYVNKALEQDPKAFFIWYLKARIEKRKGNNDEAIAAAKKSMELAKGTAFEMDYINNNTKLIDEINRSVRHKQDPEQ